MKNKIERLRIAISRVFSAALIGLILFSGSHLQSEAPVFGAILFALGAVLCGIASLGRLWCSLYIAGYKTNKLITEGPYSLTRNPLYFFSFLGAIGIGLATETLFFTVIMLVGFAIYYPMVISSEEKKLSGLHSDDYAAYTAATPRFFPRFSGFKEPEDYAVKPIIFRKHIFDAVWFIWILGVLQIIKALKTSGVVPTLLNFW
jgi:protein-S-isoprenylcysteine O-methyltransferase Ste14